MIVKNEEEMLARCLDSVQEADEIVVCDTGSEDRTIEVAKRYTDKVFTDFKWVDHFGKARQHSKDKCTGDWIVTIDADEYLDCSFSHVREVIEEADKEGYFFVDVIMTAEGDKGTNTFPRIYKNVPEITWHGPAHNYLRYNGKKTHRNYPSDIVTHYGYSPAHKKDPNRTLRILKRAVKSGPELTRERYYLAREYYYRKDWAWCMYHLEEYIKRTDFISERNDAHMLKAYCLSGLGRYDEAVDSAWQALKYNANFKEAFRFIAKHMRGTNSVAWNSFADIADDSDVLFKRDCTPVPMDMKFEHIVLFENILEAYKKVDVLEWGSGYSTRYFTQFMDKKGIKYTWKSMEHDKKWFGRVKLFGLEDVELVCADKDSKEYLKPKGKYDVIFVDGRNRVKCLKHAHKILKKGGVVLLHDAQRERYKEGFDDYEYMIIQGPPDLFIGESKL